MSSGDMPATKVDINASLVRQSVTAQFPQWAHLPIKPVESGKARHVINEALAEYMHA